jgi:predicted 2-oxoglutarate/Fe(II)-dependent dioxygenase YbiX
METTPQPEADAAHAMAMRAAEGTGDTPQNWAAALDHLRRSAELGSRLAQAEMTWFSGEWALARDILAGADVAQWSQRSVSLEKWFAPAQTVTLSEKPRIAAVHHFATSEVCDWLIARARPRLVPAQIYDRKTGENRSAGMRSNTASTFPPPERDLILAILRARIAALTRLPVQDMESPKVLHYLPGQEFRPHYDIVLKPDTPDYAKKFAAGDQRVLTFLLSLNDDYDGGETEFPALNKRWKISKGSALYFYNVEADGSVDPRTLHAGRPVTRGEKWMLSQWIKGHPR